MAKICHMTSAHDPEDVRIFHKECVSLAKAGYDVYLVQRGETYEKNGVHMIGVGTPSGGRLSRMTAFARRVYEAALAVDADVYHLHDPELLPYGLKLKKKGKHVIFDSHERYAVQLKDKPYLPTPISACVAALYAHYEKHIFRNIDAVIYPCTFGGEKLYEGVCPRVVLLDNTPSLTDMYDRYEERSEQSCPRPMCLIGTLSPARCVLEIIRAAKKTGLPLVLAGGFSSADFESRCKEEMASCENIRWLGIVEHDQVAGILQNASLGLCPEKTVAQYNTVDNLATKAYEYMAMALPVIVAAYPYSRKVMDTYHYGMLVDPDSVDSIAEAMRYIIDHPSEAKQMGENGRRAVKETFNWEKEERKLFALYEEILKKTGERMP